MTPEGLIIETMFRVADKEGVDRDFVLNPVQRALDEGLSGRDLIPKARQEGVSTYFLARYTAACLGKRNTRAVVISHDRESTQRMLNKVRYFLENIRGPKAVISNMSKNEIVFPKTNSMFYIGTAGARAFGRGDTITHLHCSEYAYWNNPKDLLAGLLQAVPLNGEVAIESTGNGVGNDYHRRCIRASHGEGRWKLHFFNWQNFPEYTIPLTKEQEKEVLDSLDPELEEDKLIGILTPGQILWRRYKLEEMDFDLKLFQQEYPMTLDECFQASGSSIFHKVLYQPTPEWKQHGRGFHLLEGHPHPDHIYVMGADVSAGVGQDRSSVEIFSLTSMEQVGEWVNDRIAPDTFAGKLLELGHMFDYPFLVVECNNHGIVTLKELMDSYPPGRLYRNSNSAPMTDDAGLTTYGFRTTERTKPLAIGLLRSALADDVVIHSAQLRSELSTYVEDENGKLGAQQGCFDDLVMASAMAMVGMNRAGVFASKPQAIEPPPMEDPFSLDAIISEMTRRKGDFPIALQVDVGSSR